MILREMKLDDLDAVLKIENEAFSDHWPRTAYEYEISENEFSTAFVAVDGEQIVGCLLYTSRRCKPCKRKSKKLQRDPEYGGARETLSESAGTIRQA